MSKCIYGHKPEQLKNSNAWVCMKDIPLALVADVGKVDYRKMKITEVLCTKDKCRCYAEYLKEENK